MINLDWMLLNPLDFFINLIALFGKSINLTKCLCFQKNTSVIDESSLEIFIFINSKTS